MLQRHRNRTFVKAQKHCLVEQENNIELLSLPLRPRRNESEISGWDYDKPLLEHNANTEVQTKSTKQGQINLQQFHRLAEHGTKKNKTWKSYGTRSKNNSKCRQEQKQNEYRTEASAELRQEEAPRTKAKKDHSYIELLKYQALCLENDELGEGKLPFKQLSMLQESSTQAQARDNPQFHDFQSKNSSQLRRKLKTESSNRNKNKVAQHQRLISNNSSSIASNTMNHFYTSYNSRNIDSKLLGAWNKTGRGWTNNKLAKEILISEMTERLAEQSTELKLDISGILNNNSIAGGQQGSFGQAKAIHSSKNESFIKYFHRKKQMNRSQSQMRSASAAGARNGGNQTAYKGQVKGRKLNQLLRMNRQLISFEQPVSSNKPAF